MPWPEEEPVYYLHDDWLLDLMRSDSEFLRKMGIKPCVIDDAAPKPLPEEFIRLCDMTHVRAKERRVRLTEKDAQWLKECGVGWERDPAFQLPLDFCGRKETVQET
jgi:hypothetical protein